MFHSLFRTVDQSDKQVVFASLLKIRANVNQSIANISIWLGYAKDGEGFSSKVEFLQVLNLYRAKIGVNITKCDDMLW